MADNYVGEIRMVGFTFAADGWLLCDGSLYQISQYETLYSLLGTTYGGDGQTTFGVPDLRSRVPIGAGAGPGLSGYAMGQSVGAESVVLNANTTAQHTHQFVAITDPASTGSPVGALPATTQATATFYSDGQPTATLASSAVTPNGGSGPHSNLQPCQAQLFMIAAQGIYPSPS